MHDSLHSTWLPSLTSITIAMYFIATKIWNILVNRLEQFQWRKCDWKVHSLRLQYLCSPRVYRVLNIVSKHWSNANNWIWCSAMGINARSFMCCAQMRQFWKLWASCSFSLFQIKRLYGWSEIHHPSVEMKMKIWTVIAERDINWTS